MAQSAKQKGMQLAADLMRAGHRAGPRWGDVIKLLGYDPRTPSGLVFSKAGAAAANKAANTSKPTQEMIDRYIRVANGGPWDAPAAPSQTWQEGTAGVANEAVNPFETADNMMERLGYESGRDLAFADLDAQLGQAKVERDYQLSQNEDAFNKNTAMSTDEMIGRGLFASSVKDAALYDLEATRAVQRSFLNDRFVQQELDAGRKKDLYTGQGGFNERFNNAMNIKKVQNASELNNERGPWSVAPTAGRWVAGPSPTASTARPSTSNAIPSLGQNSQGSNKQSGGSSYTSGTKKQAATAVYKKVKQPNKKGGIGAR